MKTNKLFIIAALLGTVLAGCQKEKEIVPEDNPGGPDATQSWKLKVKVTKGAETRALDLEGTTLNGFWENGEEVAVFFGGDRIGTLEVTNAQGVTADLEGDIPKTVNLEEGDELMLLFPGRADDKWTYANQAGTIASIAAGFDYAKVTLTVTSVLDETLNVSVDDAVPFEAQQSVYGFSFKVGANPLQLKAFTLSSGVVGTGANFLVRDFAYGNTAWQPNYGVVSVTPAATAAGPFYTAIRNDSGNNSATYSFLVVGNDDALYAGEKANLPAKTFVNGKYFKATVSVSKKTFAPASGAQSFEVL